MKEIDKETTKKLLRVINHISWHGKEKLELIYYGGRRLDIVEKEISNQLVGKPTS